MKFSLILGLVICSLPFSVLQIIVDTIDSVHEVDKDFLSVTIDISSVKTNFSDIDFNSKTLLELSKALAPVLLRVGGTSGDFLIFDDIGGRTRGTELTHYDFTMVPKQFDTLMEFVMASGWRLIFGLNQLLRYPNQQWDFANAELLIEYCMQKGYEVAWELGNEPDCYFEDNFSSVLNGTQGADGMKVLRKLISSKKYPVSLLAGPDVAVLERRNYLSEYLYAMEDTINATTWHHYYGNGATTTLADFYSVDVLDSFIKRINELLQICHNASFNGDLWIGETSSTYGGGTALYSSSYLSGFMWLDKLGLAAYSHKKVFRQDLIGAKYSLISSDGYPYPDYWLSLLYKKLVGTKVLNVHGALDYGRGIRVYAHCAKPPYPTGSVVLLILNVYNETVTVPLKNEELIRSPRDVYWLAPHPRTNITSRVVSLNGQPLMQEGNGAIPNVLSNVLVKPASHSITVPYLSFGYIVFKAANVTACS